MSQIVTNEFLCTDTVQIILSYISAPKDIAAFRLVHPAAIGTFYPHTITPIHVAALPTDEAADMSYLKVVTGMSILSWPRKLSMTSLCSAFLSRLTRLDITSYYADIPATAINSLVNLIELRVCNAQSLTGVYLPHLRRLMAGTSLDVDSRLQTIPRDFCVNHPNLTHIVAEGDVPAVFKCLEVFHGSPLGDLLEDNAKTIRIFSSDDDYFFSINGGRDVPTFDRLLVTVNVRPKVIMHAPNLEEYHMHEPGAMFVIPERINLVVVYYNDMKHIADRPGLYDYYPRSGINGRYSPRKWSPEHGDHRRCNVIRSDGKQPLYLPDVYDKSVLMSM